MKCQIFKLLMVVAIINDTASAIANSDAANLKLQASKSPENSSDKPDPNIFFQANPFPVTLTFGGMFAKHRAGIFGSTFKSGNFGYRSLGLEYSHLPAGVTEDGVYVKLYVEYRKFDPGLEVNSKYSDKKKQWTHDTLDNHRETHFGALIGYHANVARPLYLDIGLGWQYNTNPVDIGSTIFGIGQSIKSRQGATGELALGYYF